MDSQRTAASESGLLGGGRLRQLPTHLQGYQVSLPPALMPYTAPIHNVSESASAQRLQSPYQRTESPAKDDQLYTALGPNPCPSSVGAVDRSYHSQDLTESSFSIGDSGPPTPYGLAQPDVSTQLNHTSRSNSPMGTSVLVQQLSLSQPGPPTQPRDNLPLTSLLRTTTTAFQSQATLASIPSSRQESYMLTQSLPATLTSAKLSGVSRPLPLTATGMSLPQASLQATQVVSHAGTQMPAAPVYQLVYSPYQPPPAASSSVYQPPPAASSSVYQPPPAASSSVYQPPLAALSPVYQPPLAALPPVYQPPPAASSSVYQPPPAASSSVYQPPLAALSPVYQPPLAALSSVYQPPPAASSSVYQPPLAALPPTYQPPPAALSPTYQPHMAQYATHQPPAVTVHQRPPTVSAQSAYHPPVYQLSYPPQVLHQPQPPPQTQPVYQLVSLLPAPATHQPAQALQEHYPFQPQYTPPQLPYNQQPPRQPVPVPELPKLVHDSEREFTDLKMALDHLLNSHTELSEHYKYRVLMEHLVLDEAKLITQACRHYAQPYTAAMQALQRQYGQPHQLAQSEIAAILNSPDIKPGDSKTFQSFALRVDLLVGMLTSLEGPNGMEVMSTGHVDRLLSKLPKHSRDGFVEHLQVQGRLNTTSLNPYNLRDLADWLKVKAEAQRLSAKMAQRHRTDGAQLAKADKPTAPFRPRNQPIAVYHGSDKPKPVSCPPTEDIRSEAKQQRFKRMCLFCKSAEHYLSQCPDIVQRSPEEIEKWINSGKRCRNCGRTNHRQDACTLKKACSECQDIHLRVLHTIAKPGSRVYLITPKDRASLANSKRGGKVYLKVVPIIISNGSKSLQTYAILDDGAERTIILPAAVRHLGLKGEAESLALRTIRQDVTCLTGSSVNFHVASLTQPTERYLIESAFTSKRLALSEQTYPVATLQRRYRHLRDIQLQSFSKAQPLLLLGSDCTHLITAREPVRFGPRGGPAAVHTALGWVLQGPDGLGSQASSCYFTALKPVSDDLYQHVERLWQLDVLPFRSERLAVRSRLDQEAVNILEARTERVKIGDIFRYATPLLRIKDAPPLKATADAVTPMLRSTERRLVKDPARAKVHEAEIKKLIDGGCVTKLSAEEVNGSKESWFIPHHLVHHNGKDRLVFDCSFTYCGLSLNEQLLPGPTLGPSLIGVLLRFRQYAVAISGDIRAMFHQVRLLPEDQPLMRFVWRNLQQGKEPDVYQWQVLPFGTTSSPCCATFALQKHVKDQVEGNEDILQSLERSFYVDNCLQSLSSPEAAKQLVDKMRRCLASGGFEIRQWASNVPTVVSHLPSTARSESTELWLAEKQTDPQEPALGLRWHCPTDQLGYRFKAMKSETPTMRYIYKVLARQYDPLGVIIPYTTRAKILVQRLWAKKRGWDDPNLPSDIVEAWSNWERELPELANITLPRAYSPPKVATETTEYTLHVFCDASEQAYGSVAYLTTKVDDAVNVSFVMARSRVAPKRQQSMPRLELCAALTGAQLSSLIHQELTLSITQTFLWTDSTTVLTWMTSESCRFKVFVGTRVSEIQELTAMHTWRYVDTANNPADDLTRGKTLAELATSSRWIQGPPFLGGSPDSWPSLPSSTGPADASELKQSIFCGLIQTGPRLHTPDVTKFNSWSDLVKATQEAVVDPSSPQPELCDTETLLLQVSQADCFPEEIKCLRAGKPVPPGSKLSMLSPEMDLTMGLIRVGGRFRKMDDSCSIELHPVVLDPHHAVTRLLIQDFDQRLLHPGPDRVFAEIRRQYWVLRGRQAIKHHQRLCTECRKWRGKPVVPQMADLPPARLRVLKPPFFSTGVDCFGPYNIKVGRRNEKRWGVVFKCLTTRCVHLDLLASLDADSFLLALRRFIARRGTPSEILSDQGTNFRGAERELSEAFSAMEPQLQDRLAQKRIKFKLNPPAAPHFGGVWEREIRSVKQALQVVIGTQALQEEVLLTLLIEVEGILNAKPLGYVSSDVADPDPVTPSMLLMGRRDASLPQVSYAADTLTRRRWRHCQVMVDHFWARFLRSYLPTLQVRQKWRRPTDNIAQDTVVMVVDPQLPRAHWPVGRVVKLNAGSDGCIRSAEVQVGDKTYLRPVARLVQLPAVLDGCTDSGTSVAP
ncbi:uncharacterized protein LOC117810467 [Notolabrus celidotus]|uniref:uncharacterized protein LOC117810467 n=1 Tax=Notolabrus celidotus TaxID=1203425 RepID=UPI00149039C8|nr:uncharacterized protein LOC117810467 [Notolabrus celidotus]